MTWKKAVYWCLWIQVLLITGRYDSVVLTALVTLCVMLAIIRVEEKADGHRKTNTSSNGNPANGAGSAVSRAGGNAGTGEGTCPLTSLPNSGLETGEIIAWRHWFSFDDSQFLLSVRKVDNHYPIWPPGEPMTGEPSDYNTAGVHAWKTKRAALEYMNACNAGVVGRVALWGEIIEHERGYRAQYAKVVSLDYANLWGINMGKNKPREKDDRCRAMDQKSLKLLRELYGVTEFKLTPVKDDR